MNIKQLFRISYEKQIIYFVLLLIVFFGFTEIISLSFIKKMEYKWLFSKKTAFSIVEEEIKAIMTFPEEEVEKRMLRFTKEPGLERIVILDADGNILFDTSPFTEGIIPPGIKKESYLSIKRRGAVMVASYWCSCVSQTYGKPLYIGLFSPGEEMPFLLRYLRINSYIKLAGTLVAFILGVYFILFILSPFRKMGKVAKEIGEKEVSSVDEVVTTFNKTIGELRKMYEKEKKKVLRMEKEISLKEHLVSLGEMSAGIAHEFKNSLGTIIGFTKLAIKKGGNKPYLKQIEKEADSLNNVVNKFIFFAKPQELQKEEISLGEIIHEAVEKHPSNIKVSIALDGETNILGDRYLLKTAFANILNNAYESMENGGAVAIHLYTKPLNQSVSIIFQDEGSGIPARNRKEVFTPFFSTKADGTGLGLSIVYKVITLHNGDVRIKSSNKGTVVEVELPISPFKKEGPRGIR